MLCLALLNRLLQHLFEIVLTIALRTSFLIILVLITR